jgi:hypothetical protein
MIIRLIGGLPWYFSGRRRCGPGGAGLHVVVLIVPVIADRIQTSPSRSQDHRTGAAGRSTEVLGCIAGAAADDAVNRVDVCRPGCAGAPHVQDGARASPFVCGRR